MRSICIFVSRVKYLPNLGVFTFYHKLQLVLKELPTSRFQSLGLFQRNRYHSQGEGVPARLDLVDHLLVRGPLDVHAVPGSNTYIES